MRVSHHQRAHGTLAVVPLLASRLDPLYLSGDKRGRSSYLLFAVVEKTPVLDSDTVCFLVENLAWCILFFEEMSTERRGAG